MPHFPGNETSQKTSPDDSGFGRSVVVTDSLSNTTQANASSIDSQKVDRSLISLDSIYNRRLDATS